MGIEVFGGDRGQALALLWEQFHEIESLKDELLKKYIDSRPEESNIHFWVILFADYILDHQDEVKRYTAACKKGRETPGPWAWFKENKGICPTCQTDLNELMPKVDLTPHKNGTCKE